jgi:hypothetical protein
MSGPERMTAQFHIPLRTNLKQTTSANQLPKRPDVQLEVTLCDPVSILTLLVERRTPPHNQLNAYCTLMLPGPTSILSNGMSRRLFAR